MRIITNEEARKGKNTVYRSILAACLATIREIGPVPVSKHRFTMAIYRTYHDMAVGSVVYDKELCKWTHAESLFWTGNGDETELRKIMLY